MLAFLLGLVGYTKEAFDVDFDRKQDESPKFKLKEPRRVENQDQQVERLIRELQDTDSDVRSIAAVTLGEIGPEAEEAVPILIKLLQDQDAEGFVRANAATALGKIGEGASKAVPALINALEDQDEWVRASAAMALGEIGESASKAVPALVNALQDQDKYVRRYATGALGKIGKATVPALIQTLKDESINVPLFATWTFGTLRLIAVIGLIGVSGALIITIWFGIVMWKHIVLRIEMGSEKGYHSAVKENYSEYLGQTGVALTALRPTGAAMINNKRLDVISVENFIDIDTLIQVVGVNGTKVAIEKSRQQTD